MLEDRLDSLSKLKVIIDNIPSLIGYFDVNCRYVYANASYKKWFNLSEDQVLGKHLSDVVGKTPFLMLKPQIDRLFACETDSVSIELDTPYKHGGDKYVQVQLISDKNDKGEVQGVIVMVNDITDRKKVELAATSARSKADHLLKSASLIINTFSTNEVLDRTIEQIVEILSPNKMAILKSYPEQKKIIAIRRVGFENLKSEEELSFPINSKGPVTLCIETAMPIFLENKDEAIKIYPNLQQHKSEFDKGIAFLPLTVFGRVECVIAISYHQAYIWTEDDRVYLNTLMKYCSLAYEKAQLLDGERSLKLRFQKLFAAAPFGIVITQGDDHVLEYMNSYAAKMYDMNESFYGKSICSFEHSNRNSKVFEVAERVKKTKVSEEIKEYPIYMHSGKYVTTNIYVQDTSRVFGENASGVVMFSYDVSDSIKAREAIANQQKWLEQILDSLSVPLILIDKKTKQLSFANQAAYHELPEFIAPSEVNRPIYLTDKNQNVLSPDEWPVKSAMDTDQISGKEISIWRNGDQDSADYVWSSITIPKLYGHNEMAVLVFQQISEIKKKELELQLARKEAEKLSEAKSRFLANMSHEIRTPLNAILGFSEILKQQDLSEDAKANYADIIKRNGKQLSVLINDILDFSKIEAGHMDVEKIPVSVTSVLSDVNNLFKIDIQKKGLEFSIHLDPNLPDQIVSDPVRIRQILTNLVSNSAKFTQNGNISISTQFLKDNDPPMIHFFVSDTGIGLTQDQKNKLFTVFSQADSSTTRRFGGTGLGLALSQALAKLMGGSLELLKSEPHQGSTFVLKVPACLDMLNAANTQETTPAIDNMENIFEELTGTSILIADDSADNRRLLTFYLKKAKMNIEFATNGEEALIKASEKTFDIILMDIEMPIMDGYSATARLRENGYDQPIIALTANAMSEDKERSLKSGFNDHLTKPIDSKILIQRVHYFVSRKPLNNI